jgi:uncharacterized membrane protein
MRQRVVRQSRETRCVVSNRMSDHYVRYRMFVTIIEFCVVYVFGRCRSVVSRLGQVDPLLRCVVSNRMSDRYVRYRIFVTIIEFCVIYVFWTLSVCVQQIGTG